MILKFLYWRQFFLWVVNKISLSWIFFMLINVIGICQNIKCKIQKMLKIESGFNYNVSEILRLWLSTENKSNRICCVIFDHQWNYFFLKIEYRTQLGDIVFNMENNIFPGYLGQTKCPNQHDCKYCETFLNQPAPSTGEHKSSTE